MRIPEAGLFALLCTTPVAGQQPRWSADVGQVHRSGRYAIQLAPELVGRAQIGLTDLRLLDDRGREVPYALFVGTDHSTEEVFVPLPILRNDVLGDRTVLEFAPPSGDSMIEMLLHVRNAETNKVARITGSDDRQQWFMVKDVRLSIRGGSGDLGYERLLLPLPRVDHRFLRIEINDSLTAPIQVLEAGMMRGWDRAEQWVRDSTFRYSILDSAEQTLIMVRSPHHHWVDRLAYRVAGELPFRRQAELVVLRTRTSGKGRKRRTWTEEEILVKAVIQRPGNGWLDLPGSRLDTFFLRILDHDDRSLEFLDWEAWQLQRTIHAHLDSGIHYQLVFGDEMARSPRYDLSPFQFHGPSDIAVIGHAGLVGAERPQGAGTDTDPARWWVWAAIAALMAAMGWTAFRMVRSRELQEPE